MSLLRLYVISRIYNRISVISIVYLFENFYSVGYLIQLVDVQACSLHRRMPIKLGLKCFNNIKRY